MIKYPLLYLIAALCILFVGGNDIGQMVSPDGKTTAVFFLNGQRQLVCQLFEEGDPLTDPVQLNIAAQDGFSDAVIYKFREVSHKRVADANEAYTQMTYELSCEEGSFFLQVRQSNGLLTYRVCNPHTNSESTVSLVAIDRSGTSESWITLPVNRKLAVSE